MKKNRITQVILIMFFVLVCLVSNSQTKKNQITVFEGFNPSISADDKIPEIANITVDTNRVDKTQQYHIINKKINTNYIAKPLSPAVTKFENMTSIKRWSISLGLGSYNNSLAELSMNDNQSDYTYGFSLSHFNNDWKINEKQAGMSRNSLHAFGKTYHKDYILFGSFDYERRVQYTYGHQYTSFIDDKMYKNRFAYSKFLVSAISRNLFYDKLSHHTTLFISDLNEMSENRFHLGSIIKKTVNKRLLSLEIDIDNYMNYFREEISYNHEKKSILLISMSPSLSLTKYDIDFNLGFGVDYESDGGLDLFPSIIANKDIVDNVLSISLGVQDDKYRNTYKTLSEINPFIHALGTNQHVVVNDDTIQDLRTTESKEAFFTVKNILAKDEVFFAKVSYGYVENLGYFDNNDISGYNRFLVHYADVKQLSVSSTYDRKFNDVFNLKLKADYYNWGDVEILHKPKLLANALLSINLRDKIELSPSISFQSKRKSRYLLPTSSEDFLDMDPQIHINFLLDYHYNMSFSAYLAINNLTNSQKYTWSGYRELGTHGSFGLNYSF